MLIKEKVKALTCEELLDFLAAMVREIYQKHGERRPEDDIEVIPLAQTFNYNVTQGGFAQLIFNLQGEYLSEMEEMLMKTGAPVALDYYRRALQTCLARKEEYQGFLESDYVSQNDLKDELHLISFEYLAQERALCQEIEPFIRRDSDRILEWIASHKTDFS